MTVGAIALLQSSYGNYMSLASLLQNIAVISVTLRWKAGGDKHTMC